MFSKNTKSNWQEWAEGYAYMFFINTVFVTVLFCCITHLYADVNMPEFQKLEPLKYQAGGVQIKTSTKDDYIGVVGLADWDDDGDLDIFTVPPRINGNVRLYENIGTKSEHNFSDAISYLKINDQKIEFPIDG